MKSTQHESIDRLAAKKYFKGAGWIPWILIFVGIPLISVIIGIFLIIAAVIWIIAVKIGTEAYEREVDEIIGKEQEYLLSRGNDKLSLVQQQVNLIAPISVIGASYQPELVSEGKVGILNFFKNLKKSASNAPIFVQKIAKDGRLRFSLIQVNTFIFGETELYIYFAHLDITTGLIYHEGTHEYFYKDICGITTDQMLQSVFNPKKKQFTYKLFEFIEIYTYGCKHQAAFDASISGTTIDKQFIAMRNLIRDKKNEEK